MTLSKKNAKFHKELGLEPKLIRKAEANCCKWCNQLDGVYNYSAEHMKCVVEFDAEWLGKSERNDNMRIGEQKPTKENILPFTKGASKEGYRTLSRI